MKNFSDFTIYKDSTCLEALSKLDREESNQTLFVLDKIDRLIGTITDGDLRRGFIRGLNLESPIFLFCNPNFNSINGAIDVSKIRKFKKSGIRVVPSVNQSGQIERVYDLSKLKSILPVHAVIMAGGRGERLRPLTDKTPKPMLPLGNKPIIEHNIDHLKSFGIEKFTISIRYLSQQIVEYFGNGKSKGISIDYISEEEPLGTIGCLSKINLSDSDAVLVLNSDVFTNIDLEDFYLAFMNANADMAVASIPYSVDIPYAIMELEDNCITKFTEKPKNTYYANAGIYLIREDKLSLIPKNSFYNATDLMDTIILNKGKLIHSPIAGYWIDIGMLDDYNKAIEIVKHL
jgi:dTDP-glucose pyrophosphorylase